jgi:hypothetical protein
MFLLNVLQQPLAPDLLCDWLLTYAKLLFQNVVEEQYFIPVNWLVKLMESTEHIFSRQAVYIVLRALIDAGSVEAKGWAVSKLDKLFLSLESSDPSAWKDEIKQILCLCLQELVEYPNPFCTILNGFPFHDYRKTIDSVFRVISQIPLDRLNDDEARCVCFALARMMADSPCHRRSVRVTDEEVVPLFLTLARRLQLSTASFQMDSMSEGRLRSISGLE